MQVSLTLAATLAFLSLCSLLRVGLRRLLYLDKLRTNSDRVRLNYTARLEFNFRLLPSLVPPPRRHPRSLPAAARLPVKVAARICCLAPA